MSDEHHVCLGRKCCSPKMLWWNPVVVFIEAYSYLIEMGRNFPFSLFRMGLGGRNSWKYFGEFLCTDVGESVWSCKHRFLAAAVTSFIGSSSKNVPNEKHKDGFLFASSCLCYYFSHKHKK